MKSDTQLYLEMDDAQWKAVSASAKVLVGSTLSDAELGVPDHARAGRLLRAFALYYRLENGPKNIFGFAFALVPYRKAMSEPTVTDPKEIDVRYFAHEGGVISSALYWLGSVVKGRREVRRQLEKQEKLSQMYGFEPVPLAAYCAEVRRTVTFAGRAANPHNYLKDTPSFEELARVIDDAETTTEIIDALVDNFNITRKVKR